MNDKKSAFCRKAFSALDGYRAIILLILSGSILLSLLTAGSNLAMAKAWDRSPVQQEADGKTGNDPTGAASPHRVLVPFVSGAGQGAANGAADDPTSADYWAPEDEVALVEFQLPNRAAIDQLNAVGADLAEYVRDNSDGTITINAFVTPSERAQYEAMGFPAGVTVEDRSTWEAARAEREATIAAEEIAKNAALSDKVDAAAFDPGGEVTIMRVDYFTNYAGRFLAVAARTALGLNSGGPTLAIAWRTAEGSYGTATNMSKFTDASQYMYHRSLIRVGAAGSTDPVPAMVRVGSSTGAVSEAQVNDWVAGSLPPLADGYLMDFTTRYMDPTEVHERINSLAAEFPDIAEIINLPYLTNGYQRKSMAMMNGTTGILSSVNAANAPRAVYLESKAWGHEGGNLIQAEFLNPGAANSPLSVVVTGNRITVNLGTDAAGAINSTAAQVVAAINADAAASALVIARTYAGNAGGSAVLARTLITLTDDLDAPVSVQRGPFQVQAIRIGAQRDGSKIGVFFYCQQHAREWVTPLVCVETAERLLRNYAIDPTTKDFVDNLDIFIIPSYNPDGAHYSLYDNNSQRKNMTRYCSTTAASGMPASRNSWGVDNNRNNGVGSLFDGYNGASTSCTSETYTGPAKYSEPENQNEKWVVDTFTNIKFSMNIHTYGGYYMWSPGAYIASGRITLPAPNIGIEAYFFAGADLVLNRIKEVRGTVVLPERTGPIADVLYSAAGNSADDNWYRKDIIAYSFEAGADLFNSTTTGTSQSAVGFQPNYASEGRFEALEFASGNYGLLETALHYAFDNEAPEAAIVPNGGASQDPISATFKYVNEPAVIYYTLDGSTPTTASTTWEAQGPRRPGQVFLFTENTTLKWIAKDIKGNISDVSEAYFHVEKLADINFTTPFTQTYGDVPFEVSATASTTQTVYIESLTPAVCSIAGTTVTILSNGDCVLRAFTLASPGFGAVSVEATIQINSATFAGKQFFYTGSTTANTANVNLVANLRDLTALMNYPAYDGKVRFVNRDAGNAVLCTTGLIQLVNPADNKVGTASCTWTANIGSADAAQYLVGIVVGEDYAGSAAIDNAIVTVARLAPASVTGGGYLVNQSSGGSKAGDAGKRTNFGFNVKNVKVGANYQGAFKMLVISGKHTYLVHSNAITSLLIKAGTRLPNTATFGGSATIIDITNPAAPVVVTETATLQVALTDRGEPGSSDTIGIGLWDQGGNLWFSSNWTGGKTVEQTFVAGNLIAR